MSPSPRRILLGVGGGIAAYKVAALASRLAQDGHALQVAMTPSAAKFIGPATLAALSGRPVASEMFAPELWPLGPHIELAEGADLYVIAPATADLMARCAQGLADSLVTALYLQVECPVVMAPAMSSAMWAKPAVQRNAAQLRADGVQLVGPDEGWLSCRRSGSGRMAAPDAIRQVIQQTLTPVV
jgi:phosphopantothenoylcysteine decarboxylase